MRKLVLAVLLALTAGWAVAQEPKSDPAQAGDTKAKKVMTAIVVATDPTVRTITVRSEKSDPGSPPEIFPVEGAAVAHLSKVKTGEKVKLSLIMDPSTHKERVTSIEKPSPPSDSR
jgi:hypothetical protein